MRRALPYLAGWLAAVIVATGVGFAAVSLVGDDVGVSDEALRLVYAPAPTDAATARPTRRTAAPARSESASSPRAPIDGPVTRRTDGGTVTARCTSTGPLLVGFTPRDGWSILDVRREGEGAPAVTFGDDTVSVEVAVGCDPAGPTFAVTTGTLNPPSPTATESPTADPTQSVGA